MKPELPNFALVVLAVIVFVAVVFVGVEISIGNESRKNRYVFENDSLIVVNAVLITVNNYAGQRELKTARGEEPMTIDEIVEMSKQMAHENLLKYGHN